MTNGIPPALGIPVKAVNGVGRAPDIVVIGAGITGSACAAAAARRGYRTLLVERFGIGHRHGSSHGPSRIIRLAYDDTGYIKLARHAYAGWRELERQSGIRLLQVTGGLDFGRSGLPSLRDTAAAMRAADVPFTVLSRFELAGRFPQLRTDPGTEGLFQPDGGVLHADACVRALVEAAERLGCEVLEHARAGEIRSAGDGLAVQVNGRPVHTGAVIVAAGSWVNQVLAGTGTVLPVTVTREQIGYFAVAPSAYAPGRFPVVIEHQATRPYLISMFPELSPGTGSKLMLDRNGPAIEAEDLAPRVDQAALAALAMHAQRRLRHLDGLLHAETCRYTMMPDGDFVLDLLPGHPGIGIAAACSGHGFKFGPVLGEIMVDLVTLGTTRHQIRPYRLDRPTLGGPGSDS